MKTASKLTPGPWEVRQGGDHGKDPNAFDVVSLATGYPHPVARGYWGGEADMRLCAAAPALLDALVACLDVLSTRAQAVPAGLDAIRKADAAIAKAKGEA